MQEIALYTAILLGTAFGFLFPFSGLLLAPYLALFLIGIIFLSSLKITPDEIKQDFKRPKALLFGILFTFILAPLISVSAHFVQGLAPLAIVGITLYFSSPAAASSAFFSDILKGKPMLGLSASAITLSLSLIAMPLLLYLLVGKIVYVNVAKVVATLLQIIITPFILALVFKRFFPKHANKLSSTPLPISSALLFLIMFAFVAVGYGEITKDIPGFIRLFALMGILIGISYVIFYLIAKLYGFGQKEKITLTIIGAVKNGSVSLFVGLSAFGVASIPPIIAGGILNSLFLIPFGIFLGKKKL